MGTIRTTTPQSITVEFLVTEALDGVTPAPEVLLDQNAPGATPFDQKSQIYRPNSVARLGLIDPDLLLGGSIGTRCIPFLTIDTEEVGSPTASIDLVGVRSGSPSDVVFQKQIKLLGGVAGPVYLGDGFNVPQGSDLRLSGYSAGATPIRVRLTLLVPQACSDVAAFRDCGSGEGALLIQIEDEGTFVAKRSILNFIGAAVSAVDDAPNNRVDITVVATGTTPEHEFVTTQNISVDAPVADTLNNDPILTSVLLFVNGVAQDQGVGRDFTLGGAGNRTITWLAGSGTAVDLSVDDEMLIYYTRT